MLSCLSPVEPGRGARKVMGTSDQKLQYYQQSRRRPRLHIDRNEDRYTSQGEASRTFRATLKGRAVVVYKLTPWLGELELGK